MAWRYSTGRTIDRARSVTSEAKQEGLDEKIIAAAQLVIEHTRSNIRDATALDQADADALTTYYDSLTIVDGGKDFPRRKFLKGTRIRVALVTTEGGGWSADFAEFGRNGRPGLFPMTKAVYELGGDVF